MGQTTHKAVPHNGAEVNSQSCPTQWGTRLLTKLAHTMGCTSTHNAVPHNAVDVSSQRCLILRSHFLSLTITTRMLRDGFLSNNNDLNAPCHTASTFEVSVVNNGDDGKAVLLCDSQSPTRLCFSALTFFSLRLLLFQTAIKCLLMAGPCPPCVQTHRTGHDWMAGLCCLPPQPDGRRVTGLRLLMLLIQPCRGEGAEHLHEAVLMSVPS